MVYWAGKLTPKLGKTARVLYIIYLVMTLITVIFLMFGGMNLFDAIIYAMGAAGTGGFANKGLSVGYYKLHHYSPILKERFYVEGMRVFKAPL